MNAATLAAVGLDLVFGDPPALPHPVRGIGWLIAKQDVLWRRAGTPLRIAGVALWITTVGLTCTVVGVTIWLLPKPWPQIYWIYSFLAIRDLDRQAAGVIAELRTGDIAQARERLSWIVGRDTANLDEPEIVRATVETVAENLCDGIVAPLFYLAIGGSVAMAAYKAVNTLDSMVGYKNERYIDFGWCSARMDDLANWFPARLTAALVWIVSLLLPGYLAKRSLVIALRDGGTQPSPNAGYPEAAVAGALGVRLGGLNYYRGVAAGKPFLGDASRKLTCSVFPRVRVLLYGVAALAVAGAALR